MTQHKKLSARLGALEVARSSARVLTEAEAETEATEGACAAAGAAGAAAAAADLAAAENREHFEEVRACIEALTMQVTETPSNHAPPPWHPIHRHPLHPPLSIASYRSSHTYPSILLSTHLTRGTGLRVEASAGQAS